MSLPSPHPWLRGVGHPTPHPHGPSSPAASSSLCLLLRSPTCPPKRWQVVAGALARPLLRQAGNLRASLLSRAQVVPQPPGGHGILSLDTGTYSTSKSLAVGVEPRPWCLLSASISHVGLPDLPLSLRKEPAYRWGHLNQDQALMSCQEQLFSGTMSPGVS